MPGHENFILSNVGANYDWRNPQNDNLWQGEAGVNNPCPPGYRLPTDAEWEEELLSWSSNNTAGAFASPLKLPVAGTRRASNGQIIVVGDFGGYWSSTVDGDGLSSRRLSVFIDDTEVKGTGRANGLSVRCIKDDTSD